jgi:hypothetical protein
MRSKKASVQTNQEPQNEVDEAIVEACEEIQALLLQKNYQYNNSLHSEPPLFVDIDPIAGIKARINDKMNRIKQTGLTSDTEDTLDDLIGYLIHLRIAYKLKNN